MLHSDWAVRNGAIKSVVQIMHQGLVHPNQVHVRVLETNAVTCEGIGYTSYSHHYYSISIDRMYLHVYLAVCLSIHCP